jgi:TRAP-type mannitol/chloroaromatic compound transport system permease large subunit
MAFITIFLGMAEVVEPAIMGFAMAALLMAAIMTAFDLFALRRAKEYVRRLNRKD